MKRNQNWTQVILVFILFWVAVIGYFKFSDRGKDDIVIPARSMTYQGEDQITGLISTMTVDFETPANRFDSTAFITGKAYSGNYSNVLNKGREYSQGIEHKWSDIVHFSAIKEIKFSFWCYSESPLNDVIAVFSIDSIPGSTIDWQSIPIAVDSGKWSNVFVTFPVEASTLKPSYIFKLYIWNRSKQTFLVDDYSIDFFARPEMDKFDPGKFILRTVVNDFESNQDGNKDNYVTQSSYSGKFAFQLNSDEAYSPAVTKKISEISANSISLITMGVWIYPLEDNPEAVLVVTIKKPDGKEYLWEGKSTRKGVFKKGQWTKHRAQFKLPSEKIAREDLISAYVWNKGGNDLLIDDLEVVFGDQQTRAGGDPRVDMSVVPEEGYTFQKNMPPFFTSLFIPDKKVDSVNGIFELSNEKSLTEMFPGDLIESGTFIQDLGLNQLVRVKDAQVEIYGFCEQALRFKPIFTGALPFVSDNRTLNAFDINGDGTDELFLADARGKGYIIQIPRIEKPCSKVPDQYSIKLVGEFDLFSLNRDTLKNDLMSIAIDRNNDGKSELLVMNKTTRELKIILSEGGIIGEHTMSNVFLPESGDVQFLFWDGKPFRNTQKLYCLLSLPDQKMLTAYVWDRNKLTFKSDVVTDFLPISMIEKNCEFIASKSGFGKQALLFLYNRNFRFDLKKINFDNDGFYIESTVDFRETLAGNNPKFFEISKLIAGYFTAKNEPGLVTVSADCADADFSQNSCNTFEGNSNVQIFISK